MKKMIESGGPHHGVKAKKINSQIIDDILLPEQSFTKKLHSESETKPKKNNKSHFRKGSTGVTSHNNNSIQSSNQTNPEGQGQGSTFNKKQPSFEQDTSFQFADEEVSAINLKKPSI